MLESPSTSYYDEMENNVPKSTVLEPTIKQLMKRNNSWSQSSTQQNIRAEISLMENCTLGLMRCCSIYNTTK